MGLGEVNVETARQFQLDAAKGVMVLRVLDGSPANAAGLQLGDLILAWNGVEVADPTSLSFLIAETPDRLESDGTHHPRMGKPLELSVKVAERPSNIG